MSEETILKESATSSIKLVRGQRGGYGYEIKVYGNDLDAVLDEIERIDNEMLSKWGDK